VQTDAYVPGYGAGVLTFMSQRTAETHAAFFLPRLRRGWCVLDAGCGPGTITLGLARIVAPGRVIGIDVEDSQLASAREKARREALHAEFRKASVYELPFENACFDAVFSHALLEHLSDPVAALTEFRRVLKPDGWIGLRAPDLGGLLIDAETDAPAEALRAYFGKQKENRADPQIGRKLGRLLRAAGFMVEKLTASYEVITDALNKAGPSLTQSFAAQTTSTLASTAHDDSTFVALAWCEAIGRTIPAHAVT
jgi:ubiquinone/menaquinone biosynthesis C-methylase UbiE